MGLTQIEEEGGRAPRLSEVLFDGPLRTFASFAPLPSNVEAVEAALRFSAGIDPLVVIVGPSGWGKSHILVSAANRLAKTCGPVRHSTAVEYITGPEPLDLPGPLLLDDCQEVIGKPKLRLMLRLLLERRVRAGRPTMLAFTQSRPTRPLCNLLPTERNWCIATLEAPAPAERMLLIDQMAAAEGLALSPRLVRIIATQMHGNGRTLSGALKRLRLSGATWLDASETLRACGLLDPFFVDNPGWDLERKVARLAERHRARFGKVLPADLAIYTMLREARLGEADVARALEIEPSAAYLRASRFAQDVAGDPVAAAYAQRFVELVVESLAGE